MGRFANYTPNCHERNLSLASLVLTLEQAGPAATITKDNGQIVLSVTGAGDIWTVVFKNAYTDIDAQIALSTPSGTQKMIPEITAAAGERLTFKLYDVDGGAYAYGDVTAYISLRLNA